MGPDHLLRDELCGNIQAALFYPPTWIMFLFNWGRERLSYQSMQDLQIAHVWLGFFLCYLWLRGKRLAELPCVLGAGVFAFSGYMCTQLQHFGLVAAYIWIPLALWGVDQAVERRSWRPLWKVAAASALAFLAGYPPTWMVFAVAVGVYSLGGRMAREGGAGNYRGPGLFAGAVRDPDSADLGNHGAARARKSLRRWASRIGT